MRYCTNCGHQLGVGRYCTNCGARVPTTGPELPPAPSSARYPLFADTAAAPAAPDAPPPTSPPPVGPPPVAPPTAPAGPPSYVPAPAPRRRSFLPWVLGLLVLAVIAVVGVVLVVAGPSDDGTARDPDPAPAEQDRREGDGGEPAGDTATLEPTTARVPAIAPPSVDSNGDPVTFEPAHMLDGDARTCWRMPGDGSGSTVTFRFGGTVVITEVGLVNGYAKTDPPNDWYSGNRRIARVAWVFDDGTEITQDLVDDPALQTLAIDPVETTTVVLRLLDVTAPGTGPDARDFTAISDVAFAGTR